MVINNFDFETNSAVIVLDRILLQAVESGASDIHIDPISDGLLIRFRVDGIMEKRGVLPSSMINELISRIKILCEVRTDIHYEPQDGRYECIIDNKQFNIRVSIMPTYRGENAVLRLLPVKKDKIAQLSCLGFSERQLFDIDRALCKTSGIILITGPTGSGKTTTLNACLQKKSIEPLSIITLEDPIEYEVDGIRQVHVRQNHGFTFAKALRACLRQDPDIIMVGEIRDRETAEIAIHTSLTGHLVLSTIHSGRARGVLTRLMNMGIEKYLLFETLNLIIAQRLVRSICMICHGEGCEKCRSTGYGGRIVISEHISFDWFRDMTMHQKINMDISQELIMQKGFVSLEEDGRNKVIQGLTKDSEIIRVLME